MSFDGENVEADLPSKERRDRDYERFLRLQTRFEGARALYREGMGISLVRVGVLKPTPARFNAGNELIPTRGLYNQRPPKWPMIAAWDAFGFSTDSWACGYISMTANFDEAMIDAVVARAIVAEPEEYSRERKVEIGRWIHEHRRSLLAKHRRQSLMLTWQGQPMAQLADHWLGEYPVVSSRVVAESLAPRSARALNWLCLVRRERRSRLAGFAIQRELVHRLEGCYTRWQEL